MIKNLINQVKFEYLKSKKTFQPVFLIGCGRSGTTILGTTLGKHQSIAYLNERRDLWHQAYPNFDIWSSKANMPQLIAKKTDDQEAQTKLLQKLFFREQVLHRGELLLEKLPINNFRLTFIDSAFPNAKYIYLHRNGLEVARSMEKVASKKNWFGRNSIKWDFIRQLLKESDIAEKDFSIFEKGLLEWRYSLTFSEAFFSGLDKERYFSLSYQSLVENPATQIAGIFKFLNLDCSEEMLRGISGGIKRKSEALTDLSPEWLELGGKYLKLSIENKLPQTRAR